MAAQTLRITCAEHFLICIFSWMSRGFAAQKYFTKPRLNNCRDAEPPSSVLIKKNILKELADRIESIMSVQLVVMDRIAEQIVKNLQELLKTIPKDFILDVMASSLPTYKEEYNQIKCAPCGSGIAAELQMAAELKVMYLERSIEFLRQY